MTYIIIEIQTNVDGTIGTLISTYTDINQAESKYHLVLSSAAVSQLPSHAVTMLTNDGRRVKHECYHHAQPSPEPEPEIVVPE